jgi:propane monooxygenase small subunit
VQHAAPGNGDFATPTIVGAGEYDYAQRYLRYTIPMFQLLTNDREFVDHNKALLDQWLQAWVPRAISAARRLQPLWSQPDSKPPRFEDGLDRAKSRFSRILSQLGLAEPKELTR